MTAQIIYLVLAFIGLLLAANKHGKPKKNYNFWHSFIAMCIVLSLLYWGGFFDVLLN
jgi:hypothetical protein